MKSLLWASLGRLRGFVRAVCEVELATVDLLMREAEWILWAPLSLAS